MVKEWVMNQDDFDRFLAWLDPDREEAGRKYEKIRCRMIRICLGRRRSEIRAEEIADEVIKRVIRKLPEIIETYKGPREPYFFGVLRKVLLEPVPPPPPPPPPPAPPDENLYICLDRCLNELSSEDRRLLLDYYSKDGREKIELRRRLAAELGISENALRIRLTRLRATVKDCMEKCLKKDRE